MTTLKELLLFVVVSSAVVSALLYRVFASGSWDGYPNYFKAVKTHFNCTTDQFVTFKPQGRLGNKICEYVHLLHISEAHNVIAANHPMMWDSLKDAFPYMTPPPLPQKCIMKLAQEPTDVWEAHSALDKGTKRSILVKGTPCRVTAFLHLRTLWLKELQFATHLQESAAIRLTNVVKTLKKKLPSYTEQHKVTPVGVHVRRGDFQSLLTRYYNTTLLPPSYYRAAFDYYRKTLGPAVFVVLTEPLERTWCTQHLAQGVTDVVVMDDGASAEQDLAMLASFRHFVFSHGTFGLWGILLAHDPRTIAYPADGQLQPHQMRYSHHRTLDSISLNWTNVDFVKISYK